MQREFSEKEFSQTNGKIIGHPHVALPRNIQKSGLNESEIDVKPK